MIVELSAAQRDLLVALVDEAIESLGPEIHHTFAARYRDTLRARRRELRRLRELLTDVAVLEADADAASAPNPS